MSILSPHEIISEAEVLGRAKHAYSNKKTALMGFLAGVYISMGGLLSIIVGYGMPGITDGNPGLQKLLIGSTFPLGLILVVLAGADLFTGNNALLASAACKGLIRKRDVLRNWGIVYFTNFIGAVFFAYFFVYLSGTLSAEPWRQEVDDITVYKVSQPWLTIFLKAIAANWLVCLSIWLGLSAPNTIGKIVGIWWPVMGFATIGYEHCIANMFYIPLGIISGSEVTWSEFIFNNLIPATIGNIIGGAFFVGAFYWYVFGQGKVKK